MASGGAGAGGGAATKVAFDAAGLATTLPLLKGFADAKLAIMRAVAQNSVVTCAQLSQMVHEMPFSADKLAAIDVFAHSLADPGAHAPIVAQFPFSSDKSAAAAKFAGLAPAKVGVLAPHRIEDDGHRPAADMARFLSALDGAPFASDKLAIVRAECVEHPSPPFDADQVGLVLGKFAFSSDAVAVLALFVGPRIVYPMSCAQVLALLGRFPFASDKIAVLVALKPFIHDAQNKISIIASFVFSSDLVHAEEILRDCVVKLQPPPPPPSTVQDKLRRIGKCPAGYDWVQVAGGWRCQAGGHHVSDAQLAAAP